MRNISHIIPTHSFFHHYHHTMDFFCLSAAVCNGSSSIRHAVRDELEMPNRIVSCTSDLKLQILSQNPLSFFSTVLQLTLFHTRLTLLHPVPQQ